MSDFVRELKGSAEMKEDKRDAKKVQKIDDGINYQKRVLDIGAEKWKEISIFGAKWKTPN